jgi:AcrR family transcriptional regulator
LRGGWTCLGNSMAKASKKYSVAEFRLAIEAAGASPAAIARELNCTRGTVYSYLKKYAELKAAYEKAKGGVVEDKPQFPKEAYEMAIKDSFGVKAIIAKKVGCSRQTLDNAIERWPELGLMIAEENTNIVDIAESKLMTQVEAGDMRAVLFTLETKGKDRGWSRRTEVTGKDGAALLNIPADLIKQIESSGLNVVEVLRSFAAMPKPEGP